MGIISKLATRTLETSPDTSFLDKIVNADVGQIARYLVNGFLGMLTLVGLIYGAYLFIMGQIGDDPKEKRNGMIALFSVLVMSGVVLTIVNMLLS